MLIVLTATAHQAFADNGSQLQEQGPAAAGSTQPIADGAPQSAVPRDEPPADVGLRITPYAWLTGFNGSVNARGVELDIDESFTDVLDSSDSIVGLMGAVDLEAGRFVAQINGAYSQAHQEDSRSRVFGNGGVIANAQAEVDISTAWLEIMGGYRVVDHAIADDHRLAVDLLGGVRYTDLSLDLAVETEATVALPDGETLSQGVRRSLERDQDWFEPFVGARASVQLYEGWTASLKGDIGGFDVDGSSFAWQAMALTGYEWAFSGGTFGVLAGYRALGQDYSNDGFEWDVVTHGLVLGCSLRFEF